MLTGVVKHMVWSWCGQGSLRWEVGQGGAHGRSPTEALCCAEMPLHRGGTGHVGSGVLVRLAQAFLGTGGKFPIPVYTTKFWLFKPFIRRKGTEPDALAGRKGTERPQSGCWAQKPVPATKVPGKPAGAPCSSSGPGQPEARRQQQQHGASCGHSRQLGRLARASC